MPATADATDGSTTTKPGRILSVVAVGDLMLGSDYPVDKLPDDDAAGYLAGVTPVLRSGDITFGNLEGVLVAEGTPVKQCTNPAACFLFRSPPGYAQHLLTAGFDVLSLANNHARDFGEDGRTETMQVLDRVGIHHSGRRGDIAAWEVQGIRIALIAFSPTRLSYLLNDIDTAVLHVRELVQKHDLIMVSFHGGAEGRDAARLPFGEEFYHGETRGEVVRFARAVVDAGADIVIGHGPHVPRAMEVYQKRLIAYSLGNFATHWGISIENDKALAPIVVAELKLDGEFIRGRLVSAIQARPDGPKIDPAQRAFDMIKRRTKADFTTQSIRFSEDGRFSPRP